MPLDSLSANFNSTVSVSGTKNVAGLANGLGSANNVATKSQGYTKSLANTSPLGADENYSLLLSIAASGTASIDLSSFVDLAGQTVTLVGGRLKAWRFHLLGAADVAPDASSGTACSGVAIGNAASNAHTLNLSAATTTQTVNNGSCLHYGDGSAVGFVVDATHKIILLTNADAGVVAKVLVSLIGCST